MIEHSMHEGVGMELVEVKPSQVCRGARLVGGGGERR